MAQNKMIPVRLSIRMAIPSSHQEAGNWIGICFLEANLSHLDFVSQATCSVSLRPTLQPFSLFWRDEQTARKLANEGRMNRQFPGIWERGLLTRSAELLRVRQLHKVIIP
jgi:hypothetical protein